MKKLLILSFLTIAFSASKAQSINPAIPHFKILKADSTYITWTTLKKDKPVMIIYFMPDCPHCQNLMSELKQNMKNFKDIQIVMITDTRTQYPYLNLLRNFSKTYALPKYKNIVMGTEFPMYTVNEYYNLQTTPFIAIYNRAGKMTKYFDKPATINDIATAVKKTY